MNQQKLLFEDKDVKITNKYLTIKCYYFPIGTAKRIPLQEITKVEVRDLGVARMRLWGMDAMAWGYWLPGDIKRCSRDNFVAVYIGKCIVPSFTTEHTSVVYNILISEIQKINKIEEGNEKITGIYIKENNTEKEQNSIERPIIHQ